VGYHPLTREAFEFADVTSWFDIFEFGGFTRNIFEVRRELRREKYF